MQVRATKAVAVRKVPRKRSAGRPASVDTVGRERIIECTVTLLKQRAPEVLTILEIAEAAGVNRSLVRYYFGDLKGLLRHVTEDLMQRLQDVTQAALLERGTLSEQVRKRLVLLLGFMREHPHFQRLALTEIYYADPDNAAPSAEGSVLQRITERGLALTRLLFQETEVEHVDPRFIHLTLLAISAFVSTAQPLLNTMFGTGAEGRRNADAYVDFVTGMIVSQIQNAAR